MSNCVFCDISRKSVASEILYEDDHALAILDIHPIHYGHSLVIPKIHCKDFLELPEESYHSVLYAAKVVTHAVVDAFHLDGYNLFSNNGPAAGQSVFHFHLHITPRYTDDHIRFVLSLKNYQDGEIRRYADLIRQHIQASTKEH